MTLPEHALRFDRDELRSCFDIRPFRVQHELEHHALFQIDALLEAADQLPAKLIECNAGDVPISYPEGKSAGAGLTPREIYRRMSEETVWLGLKKIDLLPEYKEVFESLLEGVATEISDVHPGMYNIEGYVFISSPRTIVPYHMDTEHNFLLQIRGEKTMHTLERESALSDLDLENYYTNTTRRMQFDPALHEHASRWHLMPGAGMHVPVTYPHFVENGDDLSISLSVTFDTPRQQARARVYKVNHHLRRIGLRPSPYGASRLRDNVKSAAGIIHQKLLGPRKSNW